jgi:hypothetical protein
MDLMRLKQEINSCSKCGGCVKCGHADDCITPEFKFLGDPEQMTCSFVDKMIKGEYV